MVRAQASSDTHLWLDHPDPDDSSAWLNHGAASNLNCVTGWFRAIVEGLFGIEVDPGGLSIVPLSLPLETLSLTGLVYKGSRWNITVQNHGKHLNAIVIDGVRWEGICKIPARYYDGREHSLEVLYGSHEPTLQFREIINAEVIDVKGSHDSRTTTIHPLGTCDVLFFSCGRPDFFLNGKAAEFAFDERIRDRDGPIPDKGRSGPDAFAVMSRSGAGSAHYGFGLMVYSDA